MNKALLCSIATASVIYSGVAVAQNQNQELQRDECERLAVFIQENPEQEFGVAEADLRVMIRERDLEACRQQIVLLEEAGVQLGAMEQRDVEGRIVVEQNAPDVRIDQVEPRITVRQAQPDVAVTQPRPEIIVRQPAPQVTVNIPQPEIIVRMDEPQVRVSQAQPQVRVQQPEPNVQVIQPDQQARVLMEQDDEAQVRILETEGEPNVQIQRSAQPNVRYEAEEPEIRIMRAEGEPQVRYEQMAESEGQVQTGVEVEERTEQGFAALETERMATREMTGAVGGQMITAEELKDMDVVNARGEQLGDIENLALSTQDQRTMAIISHGGFLGLGEKRVAVPLERLSMLGDDRLVIRGLTDDQIRQMPEWEENDPNYQVLEGTEQAEITVN